MRPALNFAENYQSESTDPRFDPRVQNLSRMAAAGGRDQRAFKGMEFSSPNAMSQRMGAIQQPDDVGAQAWIEAERNATNRTLGDAMGRGGVMNPVGWFPQGVRNMLQGVNQLGEEGRGAAGIAERRSGEDLTQRQQERRQYLANNAGALGRAVSSGKGGFRPGVKELSEYRIPKKGKAAATAVEQTAEAPAATGEKVSPETHGKMPRPDGIGRARTTAKAKARASQNSFRAPRKGNR